MGEKKTYTCPNAACKKDFAAPLKALNLQDTPSEPYYACPICLTRIESFEQKPEKAIPQPKQFEVPKQISKGGEKKPAGCQFHLGYLSTRGKKEIPDDCLACMDVVECMLNKMRIEQ